MTTLVREWLHSLRRLFTGPQSLERSLAFTVGGLLLAAILVLAISAVGLLRKQAEQQALARVQLAGVAAREELRRVGEDSVTAARGLASRPGLQRLIREGDREQLELFLRRSCEVAGMTACAVTVGGSTVLGASGPKLDWTGLLDAISEQGQHFMFAPAAAPDGLIGATADVPNLVETQVIVLRLFDAKLASRLAESAGVEVRLVRLSKWRDNVEPRM
jgi:hypothetical protein